VLVQMNMNGVVAPSADPGRPSVRRLIVVTVSMASFAFAACYLHSFVFPDIPILPGGDAIGFVNDGARIVAGQLPYRDFFEMLPPGTPITYALLIKSFGLFNWIPFLTMAVLAATTVALMTIASARIMHGYAALLPALLFTGFILLGSADATHHWFSTVLVLAATLALFDDATLPRAIVAGVCCGAAACFTQSKGFTAMLGLVIYLIWQSWGDKALARECWRRCLILCAAALFLFAAVNSYFIATAGLSRWFYCLVTYPLLYYPAPSLNNLGVLTYGFQWHRSTAAWIAFPFVYGTVPGVYLVFLFLTRRRLRHHSPQIHDRLMLVTLIGIAMFLAVASSPSVKRLSTVSPPAMILLAWLLDRPGRAVKLSRTSLGTLAVVVALAVAVRTQTRSLDRLDLPAGRTAFTDRTVFDEYSWVRTHTRPGQFFWGMPLFYLPFHLENPAEIQAVDTSEYTRPQDVSGLIQALQLHKVPMIVLASEQKYPLTVELPSNHLAPFVAFLRAHYRLTKAFENGDEVWETVDSLRGSSQP